MRGDKPIWSTLLILGLLICHPLVAEQKLRLATTTSTENSGLLEILLPLFKQQTGYSPTVFAVGSGRALQMGRNGEVDALLLHAPKGEKDFVAENHGLARHPVMSNDFVILGPAQDPAGVAASTSVQEAMKRIADSGQLFISRGDGSGTHRKEIALWQSIPLDPHWQDWYREYGSGMAATILYASDEKAYTLADRGTWLAKQGLSNLHLLYSGDPQLLNPYSVIPINPDKHPAADLEAAQAFVDWLTSPPTQRLIADFRINNYPLFQPALLPASDQEPGTP